MKRMAFAALLVGFVAGSAVAQVPAAGAAGQWYTATTYTVKPGMMDEFRELVIKELNPAARTGGLKQVAVWRYATGGGERVLRIVLHESLADRDGPSAVQKGISAEAYRAFLKKRATLIASTETYIGRTRPDMADNPAGSPAPKLAERYTVRIAQGRNADYVKYVQTIIEASKKTGHRRTTGERVFGADAGTFVSNTYYESYADLAKGRPHTRTMSPAAIDALNKSAQGLITVISRDVMVYDAAMSVAAPPTPR